jgi:hypothetical protein
MLKILTCLIAFLFIGAALFGLRRSESDLTSQTAQISQQIILQKQMLWSQQAKIAQDTNPDALGQKIQTIQGVGPDSTDFVVGAPMEHVTDANGRIVPSVVTQSPVDSEPP